MRTVRLPFMNGSRPLRQNFRPSLLLVGALLAAWGCSASDASEPMGKRVEKTSSAGSAESVARNKVSSAVGGAGDEWPVEAEYRKWRFLVLHHTATEAGSVESIHAEHLQRRDSEGNPWKGIGYHFLIGNGHGMKDGEIAATFRWRDQEAGAHAGTKIHNESGIGICLVGDFENNPPTEKQQAAVRRLVTKLRSQFGIAGDHVIPHGRIKATACPGKLFEFEHLVADEPADEGVRQVSGLSE
jgi:N-acetyl-anhydromuramyl-L-alanine amidase AmpD